MIGKINSSIKYILIVVLFLLAFVSCITKQQNASSWVDKFKSNYTQVEIELFNDIAFSKGYIRKWDKDIRVQVIGESGPRCANIDSVIKIIEPLIAPLKITQVKNNGNLIVYRGVVSDTLKDYWGFAEYESSKQKKSIQRGVIYESKKANYNTLMHEFEHILGLNHPRKIYPFDLLIWGSDSPQKNAVEYHIEATKPRSPKPGHVYFDTWKDYHSFEQRKKKEMLSLQEKKVIRMLYSPEIKSGLEQNIFMEKMGIKDDIGIWK